MSASVRKAAGLVAAVALLAVVVVGCGEDGNPSNGGGSYTYTGGTVEIGGLMWMAENLNRATSNSWCYNNADSNCVKYGRLYTWEAAMTACPSGWRLPDTADWNKLVTAAGGRSIAGSKLKSTSGWNDRADGSSGNGTDEFGFSALPGGSRNTYGTFDFAGNRGTWWSATEIRSGYAYSRYVGYYDSVGELYDDKGFGFSARCVR
ncbi:MAG: fibrobacter succinogenes major paralogous domain-containing protein [Chitinispirillia bacterium]|nr:fibrobacter succinogenes major paralogous domain-containing protein [Chitinispirillia bacterium]MCL2242653.1 fibrobacter succinogenes major paralogous domain-containing protein [Chitinispirillia bacterium]